MRTLQRSLGQVSVNLAICDVALEDCNYSLKKTYNKGSSLQSTGYMSTDKMDRKVGETRLVCMNVRNSMAEIGPEFLSPESQSAIISYCQ